MDKMVRDLLELESLEAGELPLDLSVFDVTSLTDSLLLRLQPLLEEKRITVERSYQPEVNYHVEADFDRLEQVLQNYLINAIEHVNDQRIIRISIFKRDQYLRIEVYNTGFPIPQDKGDEIWGVFYKIDKARKRDLGGSGLGLAIVKSIMTKHGGNYGFINTSEGVIFFIELK